MLTRRTLYTLFVIPLIVGIVRARRGPSREAIVKPSEERVVLLGASSGIGRDLALVYARRGAKIALVARREDALEGVYKECLALGLAVDRIVKITADITEVADLVKVRDAVVKAWGGLDTLHILAGVPSTRPLLRLAGVDLVEDPADKTRRPRLIPTSLDGASLSPSAMPTQEGLDELAVEARACANINFVGTVLALATFLPLLAASSKSPAVHHLSSVAAAIAAPSRCLYSATKSAALVAVEAARAECEGLGVRFFSLLPGTIDNDFRTKTATTGAGGNCEVQKGVKAGWGDKLLLQPSAVVNAVITNLALSPAPAPLIPIPPFSWIPGLATPPASTVFLPWLYKAATLLAYTPLGYLYVEPSARKKYGLRP